MATLADRIRVARERSGLNKAELAQRIGVARPQITNYENGKRNPSRENIMKLATTLNVSVDWLLGRQALVRDYTDEELIAMVRPEVWSHMDAEERAKMLALLRKASKSYKEVPVNFDINK